MNIFQQIRDLMKLLPRRVRVMQIAREKATTITPSLTGMPSSNCDNNSKVQSGAIAYIEAEAAYKQTVQRLLQLRAQLADLIPLLDTPAERLVINLRYIVGMSVYDDHFTNAVGYCQRKCFYIIKEAQKKITEAIQQHNKLDNI